MPALAPPSDGGGLGLPVHYAVASTVGASSSGLHQQSARVVRRSTSVEAPRAALRQLAVVDALSATARDVLVKTAREEQHMDVRLHSPVAPVRPVIDSQFPRQSLGSFSPRLAAVSPAPPHHVTRCISANTSVLHQQSVDVVLGDIAMRQRDLQDTVERLACQMDDLTSTLYHLTREGVGETVYSPPHSQPEAAQRAEESSPEAQSCERQSSRRSVSQSGSVGVPPEVCAMAAAAHASEGAPGVASSAADLRQAIRALQDHQRSLEDRNICLEARNKCLEEAFCELCRRVGTLEDRMSQSPSTSPRAGAVRLPPRQVKPNAAGQASTPQSEVRSVSDASVVVQSQ